MANSSYGRKSRQHIGFWIGHNIQELGFNDKYILKIRNSSGNRVLYTHNFFKYTLGLLREGLQTGKFSFSSSSSISTKDLYLSYVESLPPPKIEIKYPDRD